jgi:hypothetical protein
MIEPKQFRRWLELRARLLAEERAFAKDQAAWHRGEPTDVEALSIKHSEIRALRALSRSLIRKSLGHGEDERPEGR